MHIGNLPTRRLFFAATFLLSIVTITVLFLAQASPLRKSQNESSQDTPPSAVKQTQINLDKAANVALPASNKDLKPEPFTTPDGKEGWVVRIPGSRPIATPAYADGIIYVGGGYGSHEFYALEAETGRVIWQMKTQDDGPTAAVVEDGSVVFNTESCTVIVADAKTGKVLWQEWLGDPLMSQPAISKGRLYIAYPAGQRRAQNAGGEPGHRMLCADLKTGRHLWEQKITGDVISAPVVSGDQLLFTCFDGTSFCLEGETGAIVWQKQNSGTSAPLVAGGQVVMTSKEMKDGNAYEGLKRLELKEGKEHDREMLAKEKAGYLKAGGGGGVAIKSEDVIKLDYSVGFSSAPSAAKLSQANAHLGVSTVAGAWAYQGSRAAYRNGQMMNAQGRYLNSIRAVDGRFSWRAEVIGAGINDDTQVFSPPALGKENLYLCSGQGHIISVRQQTGEIVFNYALNHPMVFQPALARGNIYVGTVNGMVICLKTGTKDADGWYAWGGNAQHNKNE